MATVLGANSVTGGYEVANSWRNNSGSDAKLSKTFSSVSNSNTTFTVSAWVKRSKLGANQDVVSASRSSDGLQTDVIRFGSGDDLRFYAHGTNSSVNASIYTNRKFRDVGAWYHIVVRVDTTQSTAANRVKIYVNGVQETSFSGATYPPENGTIIWGLASGIEHTIGAVATSNYFGGYFAEVVYLDSQSVAPTTFGEFDDSGIWKPIDVSDLTFGNNSFYLNFQTSAELGDDVSGNTNDFTENSIDATDQSTDTCTNNFATFNSLTPSLQSGGVVAYSEGNTKIVTAYSNTNYLRYPQAYTTLGVTTGKWYAEFKIGAIGSAGVGIANTGEFGSDGTNNPFAGAADSGAVYTNGGEYRAGAFSDAGSQGTYTEDDIIGCALDLDNLAIYWHKNGTYINSGDPTSGSSKTGARAVQNPTTPGGFYVFTAGADNSGNATIEANFGSPSYANSSSATDGRVHGDFEYAPPSGFFALCSKNLGEFG